MKTPPHNLDYERELIGSAFLDPEILNRVSSEVFYNTVHGLVWSKMRGVYSETATLTPIAVYGRLESALESLGGLSYLASIESRGSIALGPFYATELERMYKLRELAAITGNASRAAAEGELEPRQVLANLEADLTKLFAQANQRGYQEYLTEAESLLSGVGGIPTGYFDLDAMTGGLSTGGMTILAGRPSMGKSSLARQILTRLATQGIKSCLFTFDQAAGQVLAAEAARKARVSIMAARQHRLTPEQKIRLAERQIEIGKLWQEHIELHDSDRTLGSLLSRARASIRRGARVVMVDYGQLVDAGDRFRGLNEGSGETSKQLKALATDYAASVVVLSQLSRKVEERSDKRPIMSDLRDSGQWEQDADQIWALYRDEYYNKHSTLQGQAELAVLKQKLGAVGVVTLTYRDQFGEFRSFEAA